MSESILSIINIQEIWESITLKFASLLNPENFQFLDALQPFWNKVSENPLASIIILLALIGLPYTLIKAKKSSSEASERLDRLMEEMKDFELEKPVINLQDKFKDTSLDIPSSTKVDNEFHEFSIAENSVDNDEEPASFTKQFTLDEESKDDFLTPDPFSPHPETNVEILDLPPLEEDFFDLEEISNSVDSKIEKKKFEDLFIEDLQISDEDRELVSITEGSFEDTEINQPIEPDVEKKEYESHDIDDLQTRMEQAIKKLRMNYPSSSEEKDIVEDIDTAPDSSVFETVKKPSIQEESKQDTVEGDNSHSSQDSTPLESHPEDEESLLKQSHLITHLQSFQKNLENQFDPTPPDSKKKLTEPSQTKQSSPKADSQPTN